MSEMYITGSCRVKDGCYDECNRFRAKEDDENLCAYCGHDISAHEILEMIDGKMISLVVTAANHSRLNPLLKRNGVNSSRRSNVPRTRRG